MSIKRVRLNFKEIISINDFHQNLKLVFGFPEFYGSNVNALIDCWSSMRYPDEMMSEITLDLDEILEIEAIGLSNSNMVIVNNLMVAIQQVNDRETKRGRTPSIHLVLVE